MAHREGLSTRAVHAGAEPPRPGAPVVRPIVESTTFFSDPEDTGDVRYTRYANNPNHVGLGERIAALEGTEAALVVASGMAAISMTLLTFAGSGDHVVAARELYGGTFDLLRNELPRYGIETTFMSGEREWRSALTPRTRLLYAETLSNPLLRLADLPMLRAVAAERGIPLVVDATFTPAPTLCSAAAGADVVLHSATKYLGGHTDVTAGVVAGPAAVVEEVRTRVKRLGGVLDPHATWLLERGVKTLVLRVERQNATALEIARRLERHGTVAAVHYPGLPSHADHERARSMLRGFGAMLGVVVAGGDEAALRVMRGLRIVRVAPSLGGVESLASMPRFTSHAGLSAEERLAAGIEPGFIRLSVGIEDVDDLWRDLGTALERASG